MQSMTIGIRRSRGAVRWVVASTCAAGALVPVAAAQVTGPAQRVRVAVMDLSGSALRMQTTVMGVPGAMPMPPNPMPTQTTTTIAIPPPSEFARGLTEMLTTVLMESGRFLVLERAATAQLEQEQSLGETRTTKETAARLGALLGAQTLITGDITSFTFNRSSAGGSVTNLVRGLGVSAERVTAEVALDLRLIDASSGEVLASAQGKGKASQTGVAADLMRGEKTLSGDGTASTPLGQASRQAIASSVKSLLARMPAIRWSALIVDVRDGVVYLGAAAADGMRPGLELEVYEMGEPLVDPGTGQSLGAPERLIGSVRVETVLEKFSTASVLTGEAIARGHVVRAKGASSP
jgi:curli biogenesis system outer membrane secretion channel CsgG